jgi:hypothetical protein
MEELVPILSLIIIVAAITTLIISLGAFFLYKIRENKNRQFELIKSSRYDNGINKSEQNKEKEIYTKQAQTQFQEQQFRKIPLKEQLKAGVYTGQNEQYPQNENQPDTKMKTMVVIPNKNNSQTPPQKNPVEHKVETTGKKFLKYTSEGYVPADKTKAGENIKWR